MNVTGITLNTAPVSIGSLPAGAFFSTDNSGSDLWVRQEDDETAVFGTRVTDGLTRDFDSSTEVWRCTSATLEE